MKKFTLEDYKSGKTIITKRGDPVTILKTDRVDNDYPIIGLVKIEGKEEIKEWTSKGECKSDPENNLYIQSFNIVGYTNIYLVNGQLVSDQVGLSEDDCKRNISMPESYVATAKLEFECDTPLNLKPEEVVKDSDKPKKGRGPNKKVLQYKDEELIETYPSVSKAAKFMKVSIPRMNRVIDLGLLLNGYTFKFESTIDEVMKEIHERNKKPYEFSRKVS